MEDESFIIWHCYIFALLITVEHESRKRKATVSPPTQEDDDDFANPAQRNNSGED